MSDGFQIDDPEQLELELRAEEAAKLHAREFIADLIETAGHTLRLKPGDYEGVVREAAQTLYDAGFDPRPDELGDDPIAWTFAGMEVFRDLEVELSAVVRATDAPPLQVAGYLPVYPDPMLAERTMLMIHRDAVAPTAPGNIDQPWRVRHPEGVVVVEVGAP